MPQPLWPASEAWNVEAVGYHDLGRRPGFKLAMQERDGRFYLYISHFWSSGWSVLDVTDPADPRYETFIEGPPNTFTLQVQVADGLMIGSMQEIYIDGWGGDEQTPYEEGVILWDVATDPAHPRELARWRTGSTGTHRNFYAGGRYAHLSAAIPGIQGHGYRCIDVSDPERPTEVSRWSLPAQDAAHADPSRKLHLHGGAYVDGDYAYLPYSQAGLVILDISDIRNPREVSTIVFPDAMGGKYAVHSAVPVPGRDLLIINSEMVQDDVGGPLTFTAIVDIADKAAPRLVSFFPIPVPSGDLPLDTYIRRGGWFGPHNQHQPQFQSALESRDDRVYLTYFNAGLRIYDISNERYPTEIAHYVPADPQERLGPAPSRLAVSSEDVLVDRRGYIYLTDKNLGVQILRCTIPSHKEG